jgi:peptidyl-prolyl cis-trans isomerase C
MAPLFILLWSQSMWAKERVAALGILLLSTPVWAQQPSTDEDTVVAIVDGVAVHRSELEEVARGLPEQFRQMPMQALYGILLDRVIDFRLLANEAERREVADDPAVEAALARARADVLRDALVQQRIREETTADKLRERYEGLKQSEDFAKEEVHARHILTESEEEAKAVIEELQGGADFAALAAQRSVGPSAQGGGDLGFFRREQMVPEFAEAAFALEPGEITTEPVQTQFGWHVIKVLDRRTAEPTFAESEPQLRQELAREIVTALVADLREDAEIERFNLDGTPLQVAPGAGDATPEAGDATPEAGDAAPEAE